MHYNFLFNGCSWTFGAELEGITDNQEHSNQNLFNDTKFYYSHLLGR